MEEIINKVAISAEVFFDLEDYYPKVFVLK
jgi:hypothetical protein